MTDPELKATIIGLRHGHAGRLDPKSPTAGHVHTFKQLPGVKVVAYCEDTDSRLLDSARAFDPDARFYQSVDDLIAHEDFDVACVCLPASEVPGVGIKLARAGKHFFMEKQFARTPADLASLVHAVRESGVRVLAGYPWRFHPVSQHIQRLRDEDILGRPLSIEARQVTTQVRPGVRNPSGFQYRNDTEGGGILHMLGGHYLDVMGFLAGCRARAVQAMVGRPLGFIEAPLEDLAILAIEYENGAFGSLHAGYLLPGKDDGYDTTVIYRGETGTASWASTRAPRLVVKSTVPSWAGAAERAFDFTLAPFFGYGRQTWHYEIMRRFMGDLRARREPALPIEDALHTLQLIEAAYESARTGRRIEVPSVQAAVEAAGRPAAGATGTASANGASGTAKSAETVAV